MQSSLLGPILLEGGLTLQYMPYLATTGKRTVRLVNSLVE